LQLYHTAEIRVEQCMIDTVIIITLPMTCKELNMVLLQYFSYGFQ